MLVMIKTYWMMVCQVVFYWPMASVNQTKATMRGLSHGGGGGSAYSQAPTKRWYPIWRSEVADQGTPRVGMGVCGNIALEAQGTWQCCHQHREVGWVEPKEIKSYV